MGCDTQFDGLYTEEAKYNQRQKDKLEKPINESQVGGTHYKKFGADLQPWDVVVHFNMGYFEGTILKYLVRWKDKGGVEDLKKARHYLDKLIEINS